MANINTKISWTDATWSPLTGCTKVSPGCLHCYAATLDKRFHRDGPFVPWTVAAQRKAGVSAIHLHPERLDVPLHWKKPRRIFVNSMSDLFHEDVPDEFIKHVWEVMHEAHRQNGHIFQVLTKRPQRMMTALGPNGIGWYAVEGPVSRPEPGIWLGVSVENQRYADERLPVLAQVPAAVRFVSVEPMLGPIDLGMWLQPFGHRAVPDLSWVICGGESGPGYRPMQLSWLESIAAQCQTAGVPLFVKQDSGPRPGQQGRIPDALWSKKEMP